MISAVQTSCRFHSSNFRSPVSLRIMTARYRSSRMIRPVFLYHHSEFNHLQTTDNFMYDSKNRAVSKIMRYFSSSVSESEVKKFSDLSKSWWDPSVNPLVGMNTIRMEYIINEIQSNNGKETTNKTSSQIVPLSDLSALDIGCGGGLLSESLARLGANVTAIDPSMALVEQARKHSQMDPKTQTIQYRGGYTVEELAEELSRNGNKFDIICLLEVIEHVTDVDSILLAIRSLLKPDTGRLFISTINRTIKSKIIAIIGAEYIMRYLPPGTHDWNQFRSPKEMEELMDRIGFQQINVQGMVITKLPFFGKWHWKLDPIDRDVNWIGTYKIKS